MTDDLDRVRNALTSGAAAYQKAVDEEAAALEALAAARQRREAVGEVVKQRRAALHEAVLEAARLNMRQVEIVQLSGYTRDRVYNIVRAAEQSDGDTQGRELAAAGGSRRVGRKAQPPIPGADPDVVFGKRKTNTSGQRNQDRRGRAGGGPGITDGPRGPASGPG